MKHAAGLELQDFKVSFGHTTLVHISCVVQPGEIVTVMGKSGAGKSSLLAAILGALPPGLTASGKLTLNGRDITGLPPEKRNIGLLFQDDLLFPHLSVAGNLAFGLKQSVRGARLRNETVEKALCDVGLDGLGNRDPASLSGGQRARVALMRTLLADPQALLLDEPFSRLDSETRAHVRRLVIDRSRARGLPVLMVTHDQEDAAAAGRNVIRL